MYHFLYGFFYLFSLLPMRVLYLFSDFVYVLVYYVMGYRKAVVFQNLQLAFPEKTEEERTRIAKLFYHNLIDSFVETLKQFSASRKFLEKRISANWEVLEPLYKTGRSCQMHLGHTFNWEWGHHVLGARTEYQILVVYMPITNPVVEKLMYNLRTRHGNKFIPANQMSKSMAGYKNSQYLLGLVADQSPGGLDNAYWFNFFGRATPFVSGPEKGARVGNVPVIFTSIVKPRRGYYQATLEIASENPATLKEGELTMRYAKFMEKAIRERPEMWLWSHRRWKHSWNPKYQHNWLGTESPGLAQSDGVKSS
ncbi:MAG TPA: lipid A biosynthesis acyltransferase [Chitinophagaceae bacterium]|nr:lipid A biosynthesis acyltransferase [Chitinophagaceae bacterium]